MNDESPRAHPFRIASHPAAVTGNSQPVREPDPHASPLERVERMVGSADLFLFIKGTPEEPLCGFSANVLRIIDSLGVPFKTFDVLSDESIRVAGKEYSAWPTFPQVYVRGEFIGGNDIVSELAAEGGLRQLVEGHEHG